MRRIAALAALLAFAAAAPALGASEGDGHGGGFPIWEVVNFAILVAVLVYFGRGPLQNLFSTRRKEIADEIETASSLLERAETRNAEWQRKLADLERELDGIRSTARRRAEEEREHILAEAQEAAERIQRDAVASVEQELRRAQAALRDEAARLATELAAGMLRDQVGDADRERLVDEFISGIGNAGAEAGGR